MNDKDRDKIKEIAINIREGADNVETVLDSTKEAIFLLINGVNKDGRGGVYGSADQFLNVLLSVASDYLNEKNSRINVNSRALRGCTISLAELYVNSCHSELDGLATMGEHILQQADNFGGDASWAALIGELRRRSG